MIKELLQVNCETPVAGEQASETGCAHRRVQSEHRADRMRRRMLRYGAFGLALILSVAAGVLAVELWSLVLNPAEFPLSSYTTYALQNLRWVLAILIIGPVIFMAIIWRTMAQERAKAEALARARKNRDDMRVSFHQLRHVFTSLPVPYVLTHMDGRLIQGNVDALDAFGLDPANLSKYNLFDMIEDDACRHKLQAAMNIHQRCEGGVLTVRNAQGGIRWFLIAASCVVVNQRPLMFVTFTDISGQKQAEQALQKNESALRGIIESSPLPTIIFDPVEDYIAFANNAARTFLKDVLHQDVGMTASSLWETHEQYQALVNEIAVEGSLHDQEMRLIGRDGDVQWVQGSLTTVMHRKREMVCCGFTDITVRKLKELELVKLATTDPLTGTLNRRAFHDQCLKEHARAQRGGYPLSLVACDLDHFKRINDEYGHATGDEVLRQFTRQVQQTLRPGDLFGRIGGEEFAILLPGATPDMAEKIANRVQGGLKAMSIAAPCGKAFFATASFGVAQWHGASSLDAVLSAADGALYLAKRNGRDRIQVAVSDKDGVSVVSAE